MTLLTGPWWPFWQSISAPDLKSYNLTQSSDAEPVAKHVEDEFNDAQAIDWGSVCAAKRVILAFWLKIQQHTEGKTHTIQWD